MYFIHRFGAKSGDWHNTANAGSRAANKAAFSDIAQNKWGERNDKNFADAAQLWKKGDQFYNGRRNKDNIDYAYDKSFDLRDSENGGYEVDEAASAHALDDYADKSASYDRNIDKNAAWASAADAQSADRKAAAGRRASNSDSNWDNFARSASSANAANGRNKDWAQKLDTSEGSSGLFTDTRRSASDIYKDLALADSSYGRNNKVFGGKGVRQGEGVVAYGIAGIGGYAARPVLVGPGAAYAAGPVALGGVGIGVAGVAPVAGYSNGQLAKAAGSNDQAAAWDQTSASKLRNSDASAYEKRNQNTFSKDNWLSHRDQAFDKNNKADAKDAGFSDWARKSDNAASGFDVKRADAASKWAKDQGRNDFNEDVWAKENAKKNLQDRDEKKKIVKKYYNNKRKGGDNWERLNFDRDQKDDVFGFNNAFNQDWASKKSANNWNEGYDANARQAALANAREAAKDASNAHWVKDKSGFQNANAAAKDSAGARHDGYTNEAWKGDKIQSSNDAAVKAARAADRAANRSGAGAGTGTGAGFGGVLGGAAAAGAGAGDGLVGGFGSGGLGGVGGGFGGVYGGGLGGYGGFAAGPYKGGY